MADLGKLNQTLATQAYIEGLVHFTFWIFGVGKINAGTISR